MPATRASNRQSTNNQNNQMTSNAAANLKRQALEGLPGPPKVKRAALGDVTNAIQNQLLIDSSKKAAKPATKKAEQQELKAGSKTRRSQPVVQADARQQAQKAPLATITPEELAVSGSVEQLNASGSTISNQSSRRASLRVSTGSADSQSTVASTSKSAVDPCPSFDYDAGNAGDPFNVPNYARDIFTYYMYRETLYTVPRAYLPNKCGLSHNMRTILVDWMVEIQENFELNHETLYQAVKMADLYMAEVDVTKENAQLVGATALFISAKFDERQPPCADDFLYICDDAYTRDQLLRMEEQMLKQLRFDIGMPLSYRFLRRYAKTTEATMELLTLARYILEQSLLYIEFVHERDSMMAAAAFLLALRMTSPDADPAQLWTPKHHKYSEYSCSELEPMVRRLNATLTTTANMHKAKTIHNKYSHEVFFKVACIAPLPSSVGDSP